MTQQAVLETSVPRPIEHFVFHADEARELAARYAELSGSEAPTPDWAGGGRPLPAFAPERLVLAFGVFGSI